jgi:hypothetical protein
MQAVDVTYEINSPRWLLHDRENHDQRGDRNGNYGIEDSQDTERDKSFGFCVHLGERLMDSGQCVFQLSLS